MEGILLKYVYEDVKNIICSYVYRSMYYDVMNELRNSIHLIIQIPYRGQLFHCNGIRVVIEQYPNTPLYGYCGVCGIV